MITVPQCSTRNGPVAASGWLLLVLAYLLASPCVAKLQALPAPEISEGPKHFCGNDHSEAMTDGELRALQADPNYTLGLKSILLIRVDFSDLEGVPFSDATATNILRELHTFFDSNSYHQFGIKQIGLGSQITPTLRMPIKADAGISDWNLLRSYALSGARNAGYDPSAYDFDVVWFGDASHFPGIDWLGRGKVGERGAWVITDSVGVFAHELGHNLGLHHANFFDKEGQSTLGPAAWVEYGDIYDTMGSEPGSISFNALAKRRLNWIPAADILNPAASGVYRITAHDEPEATGARALRFGTYGIEFRQRVPGNRWMAEGVTLREYIDNQSSLLDLTPGTRWGREDAALLIGRTYSDRNVGIHLTPIGKGGTSPESIDLVVTRGNDLNNRSPTVSLSVPATSARRGGELYFQALASDPNCDPLAYFWDFGDGLFGSNSAQARHTWDTEGEYVVRCEVTDMKGGVSSARIVVRIGEPATLRMSGRALAKDGSPVNGVRIFVSPEFVTWTDGTGGYDLVGLTAGRYGPKAVLEGHVFSSADWRPIFSGENPGFTRVNLDQSKQGIDFIDTIAVAPEGWSTNQLIGFRSTWQYLDNGSDQGTAWSNPDFDSTAWKSGMAPLGSDGSSEKVTVVEFGPDPSAKYVTYYFRKRFEIVDAQRTAKLLVGLSLADAGGIVYLNGREIIRTNMPKGIVTSSTLAPFGLTRTTMRSEIATAYLREGANVLAVEVHRYLREAPGLYFDLELQALQAALPIVPVLMASRSGTDLSLSWPRLEKPWYLYRADSINGTGGWIPVMEAPSLSGCGQTVTLRALGRQSFFRLSDQAP